MRGHDYAGVDWAQPGDDPKWDDPFVAVCSCGWRSEPFMYREEHAGSDGLRRSLHRTHVLAAEVERAAKHADHYQRCQHCGQCGQPGDYCVCRDSEPCGCAHLHPMGSAYRDGALAAFVESDPNQGDLW